MMTQQMEFLGGLEYDDAAALMGLGVPVGLSTGQVLFRLGDEADRLFLVQRGRLALTLPMQVGGREEDVLVEEMLPGQMVGWSGLIPPHRFTLKATAPLATEVLAFPRARLLAHFEAHPEVAYAFTRNVAAVIGERLHIFQAMWLREIQRAVALRCVS
jgi:CRP-like cAMP-binding protein